MKGSRYAPNRRRFRRFIPRPRQAPQQQDVTRTEGATETVSEGERADDAVQQRPRRRRPPPFFFRRRFVRGPRAQPQQQQVQPAEVSHCGGIHCKLVGISSWPQWDVSMFPSCMKNSLNGLQSHKRTSLGLVWHFEKILCSDHRCLNRCELVVECHCAKWPSRLYVVFHARDASELWWSLF